MMAKCFNPLPRISEENETNGELMAAKPTIPRIQKVHWADGNISQEWLKQMSSIKMSVFAVKPGINLIDTMNVQVTETRPKHWITRSFGENLSKPGERYHSEGFKGSNEGFSFHQSLPDSLMAEEISTRKPDSTYIGLINGIMPSNTSCLNHNAQSGQLR